MIRKLLVLHKIIMSKPRASGDDPSRQNLKDEGAQ